MKNFKRFLSMALAILMVAALAITAFAVDDGETPTTGSIKVTNVEVTPNTEVRFKALPLLTKNDSGTYDIPENLKEAYATYLRISSSASDFYEKVVELVEKHSDEQSFIDMIKKSGAVTDNGIELESGKTSVVIEGLVEGYYYIRRNTKQQNETNYSTTDVASGILVKPGVTSIVNAVPMGSVSIGNIVITPDNKDNLSLEGKNFNAYKLLDVQVSGTGDNTTYVYTVPVELRAFYNDYFELNYEEPYDDAGFSAAVQNKLNDLNSNSTELFAFAAAALNRAKGNKPADAPADEPNPLPLNVYSGSLNGEGNYVINNLPYGYYVVEDVGTEKPISALILKTVSAEIEAKIKAEKPTIDKTITGNTTEGKLDTNTAAIGDKVGYTIKSSIPDMTGYTKYFFVVSDTLSKGLDFNNDVEVNIGDVTGTTYLPDENGTYYRTTTSGSYNYVTIAPTAQNYKTYDGTYPEGTEEKDKTFENFIPTKYIQKTTYETPLTRLYIEKQEDNSIKYYDYETKKEVTDLSNGKYFTVSVPDDYKTDGHEEITFEITFINFCENYNNNTFKGKDITVTYSAIVNKNAVVTEAGNPNTVKLIYSNNPNEESNGKPENPDYPDENDPHGETPDSRTFTYVTGVKLIKVDATTKKRLTGAEFKITGNKLNKVLVYKDVYTEHTCTTDEENVIHYWLLNDGTYTTEDPSGDDINNDKYADVDTMYVKSTESEIKEKTETVDIVATVDDQGVLDLTGLAAGRYTITEIKAPSGYNMLESDIILEITCETPTDTDIKENKTSCKWTYKWSYNGSDSSNVDTKNSTATLTVQNAKGTILPETGGIGTTIFYIVGSVLLVGAGILLVTKKRMSESK